MRRIDRRRSDHRRRIARTVGLSFALGALTALGLSWRLDRVDAADVPPAAVSSGSPSTPVPRHDPAGPPPRGPVLENPREPVAATTGTTEGYDTAVAALRARDLLLPVDGIDAAALRDTFYDSRNGRAHEAIDIMAARETPVRSVEDGRIARIFTSKAGGLTLYVFDPDERFCYYYAHLERYAGGLTEGQRVERGQVIGYVGTTGNAPENAPHLHFAIFRLTPDKRWWQGEPINPYPVLR